VRVDVAAWAAGLTSRMNVSASAPGALAYLQGLLAGLEL
jgi:hypothetical protein